jgi:DNA-binding transcriptional regulator YiaG
MSNFTTDHPIAKSYTGRTSAGEDIKPFITIAPYYSGTASSVLIPNWNLYVLEKQTASDNTFSLSTRIESSQSTINELKQLSGLTWEQLAKILNVSRRSLHFWASGKPISVFNEEYLRCVLKTIRYINRGSADLNRNALLKSPGDLTNPLNLLISGKYEEVKRLLGEGKILKKMLLQPLSPEASAARRPQSPETLVGALHESVHQEVGRSRPAKTTRSRKSDRSQ